MLNDEDTQRLIVRYMESNSHREIPEDEIQAFLSWVHIHLLAFTMIGMFLDGDLSCDYKEQDEEIGPMWEVTEQGKQMVKQKFGDEDDFLIQEGDSILKDMLKDFEG